MHQGLLTGQGTVVEGIVDKCLALYEGKGHILRRTAQPADVAISPSQHATRFIRRRRGPFQKTPFATAMIQPSFRSIEA